MLQCLSVCSRPSTAVPMPALNEPNDFTPPETNHRSFLVTLSARALGSVGFGLSILAIWLHWFVPFPKAVAPATRTRRSRQSSLPASPAHATHQITLSIMVSGNGNQDPRSRSRRVYFADTPPSLRKPSPVELSFEAANDNTLLLRLPSEESARSSFSTPSSTVPHPNDALSRRDTYDESIAESDTSSRRASLTSHLPRLIQPFGAKFLHSDQSEPSPASGTQTPPSVQLSDDVKSVRRSSIGFTAPWSLRIRKGADTQGDNVAIKCPPPFRRPSTPKATSSLRSSSTDSIQSPAPSYFSLKPHRRTSTPVPRARTQPYEAPYFATPPICADFATFDSRKSRHNLDDALINSTHRQASTRQEVINEDGNRGRQTKARGQEALSGGRPRTLPRRRSASESWINGRRAQL